MGLEPGKAQRCDQTSACTENVLAQPRRKIPIPDNSASATVITTFSDIIQPDANSNGWRLPANSKPGL